MNLVTPSVGVALGVKAEFSILFGPLGRTGEIFGRRWYVGLNCLLCELFTTIRTQRGIPLLCIGYYFFNTCFAENMLDVWPARQDEGVFHLFVADLALVLFFISSCHNAVSHHRGKRAYEYGTH